MNTFTGLLIITGLAFIISLLVACIIWFMSLFSTKTEVVMTGIRNHTPLTRYLILEWKNFNSFQKLYRTYWRSENATTNELIDFYYE